VPIPSPIFQAGDNPSGPEVTFQTQRILPPSAIYVALDDALCLKAFYNIPGGTSFVVTLRLLRPDGIVMPQVFSFTISNAFGGTQFFPPAEGFLLSATITSDAANARQCFVKLMVIRGGQTSQDQHPGQIFCQGYAGGLAYLSFPQSPIESALSGYGSQKNYTVGTTPGHDLSLGGPGFTTNRIEVIQFTLITSAAVANRIVHLHILANGFDYVFTWNGVTQTAGQTLVYNAAPGIQPFTSGVLNYTPLPSPWLLNNTWSILTVTSGLDAADQFSSVQVTTEEWITG